MQVTICVQYIKTRTCNSYNATVGGLSTVMFHRFGYNSNYRICDARMAAGRKMERMVNMFESMQIRVSNSRGAENNKDDEKIAVELYGRN